jgi:hypothetical protein
MREQHQDHFYSPTLGSAARPETLGCAIFCESDLRASVPFGVESELSVNEDEEQHDDGSVSRSTRVLDPLADPLLDLALPRGHGQCGSSTRTT